MTPMDGTETQVQVPTQLPKAERDAQGRIVPREGSGGGGRRVVPDQPPPEARDEGGTEPKKSPKLMGKIAEAMGNAKTKAKDETRGVEPDEAGEGGEDIRETEQPREPADKNRDRVGFGKKTKANFQRQREESQAANEPADDAPDGDAESGEPQDNPALRSFAKKFGLDAGLASTSQARDNALDQFAQIVGGQAPQQPTAGFQPSPSGWNGQPQGVQPPQASGHASQAPAPNQGGPGLLNLEQLKALAAPENFGPEFEPVVQSFQALTQQLHAMQQVVQRNEQREGQKIVRDFFARKLGQEGFRELLGSPREGMTQGQQQLRAMIVQNAIKFQAAMPHIEDDDALEMSFQYATREYERSKQQQKGRQAVEQQVVNRDRMRSLTPTGGNAPRSKQNGQPNTRQYIHKLFQENRT